MNTTPSSKLLVNLVPLPHQSPILLTMNPSLQSHPDVLHPHLHPPTNRFPLPLLCQPNPVSKLISLRSLPVVIRGAKNSSKSAKYTFISPTQPLRMEQKSHSSSHISKVLLPQLGSDSIACQERT